MAPERLEELWHQFTKSFIGASATVILGAIVAFVGGFFQKIDHIIDNQTKMSTELKMLSVKVDERDKATQEAVMRGVEKDAALGSQLTNFGDQHIIMLRKIDKIEDVVGKRR